MSNAANSHSPKLEKHLAFEVPSHYVNGQARRLKDVGGQRDWWLNVDYVESNDQPDFDMLRLLIRKNRDAQQVG